MINIKRKRWAIINYKGEIFVSIGLLNRGFEAIKDIDLANIVMCASKKMVINDFNSTNFGPYDGETYKVIEVTEIITDCDSEVK